MLWAASWSLVGSIWSLWCQAEAAGPGAASSREPGLSKWQGPSRGRGGREGSPGVALLWGEAPGGPQGLRVLPEREQSCPGKGRP